MAGRKINLYPALMLESSVRFDASLPSLRLSQRQLSVFLTRPSLRTCVGACESLSPLVTFENERETVVWVFFFIRVYVCV